MKGQCRYRKGYRKRGMGGSILGGVATGALSGASLGPLGIAGGAIIGGITGLLKGKKEQKAEEERKRLIEQERAMQRSTDYISDQMALRMYDNMYNEVAYGGQITGNGLDTLRSFLEASQINGGSQMLNSDMARFDGNTHAEGGIQMDANLDGVVETEVENGEVIRGKRVYSDRISPSKAALEELKSLGFSHKLGTYAKISESLGNKKKKYEDKLANSIDEASVNTAELMLSRLDEALDFLYFDQESQK